MKSYDSFSVYAFVYWFEYYLFLTKSCINLLNKLRFFWNQQSFNSISDLSSKNAIRNSQFNSVHEIQNILLASLIHFESVQYSYDSDSKQSFAVYRFQTYSKCHDSKILIGLI